mgnify:CR=1 FL=1
MGKVIAEIEMEMVATTKNFVKAREVVKKVRDSETGTDSAERAQTIGLFYFASSIFAGESPEKFIVKVELP